MSHGTAGSRPRTYNPIIPMKDTSNPGGGETAVPREDRASTSRRPAQGSSASTSFGEGVAGAAAANSGSPKDAKPRRRPRRTNPKAKDAPTTETPLSKAEGSSDLQSKPEPRVDRRKVKATKRPASKSDNDEGGEKPKRPRRTRKKPVAESAAAEVDTSGEATAVMDVKREPEPQEGWGNTQTQVTWRKPREESRTRGKERGPTRSRVRRVTGFRRENGRPAQTSRCPWWSP